MMKEDTIKKNLAKNITLLCEHHEVSRRQMCLQADVPVTTVQELFNTKIKAPSLTVAYRIACFFEITLDELINPIRRKDLN